MNSIYFYLYYISYIVCFLVIAHGCQHDGNATTSLGSSCIEITKSLVGQIERLRAGTKFCGVPCILSEIEVGEAAAMEEV